MEAGIANGATHLLIVWDIYDHDDSYPFAVFCYPGEDVQELVKQYTAPGYYRVSAVLPIFTTENSEMNENV